MNKDRVNGKIDEVVGTVKRKAGEWADDTPLQVKGIAPAGDEKAPDAASFAGGS